MNSSCQDTLERLRDAAKRGNSTVEDKPVRAWISFTSRCNFKCLHCPRYSLVDGPPKAAEMSSKIFEKIEKDIMPSIRECKVGGNNLGEQLLAKDWDVYSNRISAFNMERILVTNGTLLTREKIEALLKSDWTIDCSTEAATDETYAKLRHSDFAKFLDAVRECCSLKRSLAGTKARIRFCFTAFHDNIRELPALIEIGAELGVDEILVTHLIPMTEAHRDQSLVYHKGLANDIFDEAMELARKREVSLKLPPSFPIMKIDCVRGADDEAASVQKRKMCYHPWTSVSVDENGDVFPCCVYDRPLGSLEEASFQDIWNGRKFRRLRKTVNSSSPEASCRHCALRGQGFTSVNSNEDDGLLGAIGPKNEMDTQRFLRLKVRETLTGSRWSNEIYQRMRKIYHSIR